MDLEPLILAADGLLAFALVALVLNRQRQARTGRETRPWSLLSALVAVAMGVLLWSKHVEPHRVEITHLRLALTGRPLRVAILADLHAGRADQAMLARAVRLTNQEEPDVVLLAGDYISGYELTEERQGKLQGLRGLRARGGVFAILGNHDSEPYGGDTPRRAPIALELESFGYRVLRNEAVALTHDLWLVGVDEFQAGRDDAPLAFASVPPEAHRLAFAHDWHALDADVRFELGAVGHTHGGQVCIPFTDLCGAPLRDRPYIRGLYPWKRGGALYVNRGIGLSKLPLRFGCRPEITVFELGPER